MLPYFISSLPFHINNHIFSGNEAYRYVYIYIWSSNRSLYSLRKCQEILYPYFSSSNNTLPRPGKTVSRKSSFLHRYFLLLKRFRLGSTVYFFHPPKWPSLIRSPRGKTHRIILFAHVTEAITTNIYLQKFISGQHLAHTYMINGMLKAHWCGSGSDFKIFF